MHLPVLKVRSHGAAAAAAKKWNALDPMSVFILCGSGGDSSSGAASKWVPTPFYAAAYAAKTLAAPLPHRVNEP